MNKLHRKKVVGRGSADHLPTTYQPPTDHLPTTYRPLTDHLPTTYCTNHIFTVQLVHDYHTGDNYSYSHIWSFEHQICLPLEYEPMGQYTGVSLYWSGSLCYYSHCPLFCTAITDQFLILVFGLGTLM